MSEKRFVVENDIMYDKEREAHFVKMEEVASFLNPLSSENDYLKKENEQLRQKLSNATELYNELDVKNQICRKEKEDFQDMVEQLRQSLDSMIETSAEISNRNVLLHEQLGETQFNHKQCEKKVKELEQKLDWICEQTGYDGVKFHYINKEVVR